MVYAVGTNFLIANSIALLLGHTLAYFCVGLALLMGLDRFTDRLANPQHVDFIISLVIGVLLI